MSAKIIEAIESRTSTGHKVTIITFEPCGHQRSVGGWNVGPKYAVGRMFTDCGQGACIKAGGRP